MAQPSLHRQHVHDALISVNQLSKKFCRSRHSALLHGVGGLIRKLFGMKPKLGLRQDEFWALADISFNVRRGECLGIIGPNGAGKTTLLRLINREYRPDEGQVSTFASVKSLIRIGIGLQSMYSGRENIYLRCAEMGLSKVETDARAGEIIAFAELEQAIDAPVKTYSDGMYARLEFAIATAVPADILLVDEVLAVGDIAFQLRGLERLNQLKQQGTAIVFVSHSEMNIRQVADRCLLLFNGRQIALGEPDAVFYRYYESVGFLNRQLKPLGALMRPPAEVAGKVRILALRNLSLDGPQTGSPLALQLEYEANQDIDSAQLLVQFWNPANVLVASIDSRQNHHSIELKRGQGEIHMKLPFLNLSGGCYRLAAGLHRNGEILCQTGPVLEIAVKDQDCAHYHGFALLEAHFY